MKRFSEQNQKKKLVFCSDLKRFYILCSHIFGIVVAHKVMLLLCLYLDGSIHVGLFDAQHNLPGDSDAIEEVVDETHVVYEGVNVTGAQHQQSGDQLNLMRGESYHHFCTK